MDFLRNNKNILLIILFIILSAIGCFLLYSKTQESELILEETLPAESADTDAPVVNEKIFIDIGGEVLHPGLYELLAGSRINDAITISGGVTANACLDEVNLAFVLSDGMKITIPSKNASSVHPIISTGNSSSANNLININTATKDELCLLSGIGESTAEKIIQFRKQNGPFKNISELKNISGIGEAKFNNLKNNITV